MPRPTHDPLTDPQVRALAPGAAPIDVRDGELRGLILTVLPSGRKQFALRYRAKGKQRRLILGDYPGLSLAKARKLARGKQTEIDSGADPAAVRQAVRRAPTDTVEALAADYLAKHARQKRSAAEDERILNRDVLPYWRDRSVKSLTRRDVRALVERVAARAPVMANRVLAVVRIMLRFAVKHDWIDASPATHVEKPAPETSRDRVLTHDEIRRLWRVLSHFPLTEQKAAPGRQRATGDENDPLCPISPALAAALKVRLLTAQRGGEVARMRWADLALPDPDETENVAQIGWWTIPGQFTKNGKTHRVPLTAETIDLIRSQAREPATDNPYVFTATGAGSVLDRAKKAPAAISRRLGFQFRGHDLRRTASTEMAEAGVPQADIARVLNHSEGGPRATQVYNRYTYDREKQVALQSWARRLTAILEQQDDGKVVPFARA